MKQQTVFSLSLDHKMQNKSSGKAGWGVSNHKVKFITQVNEILFINVLL